MSWYLVLTLKLDAYLNSKKITVLERFSPRALRFVHNLIKLPEIRVHKDHCHQ